MARLNSSCAPRPADRRGDSGGILSGSDSQIGAFTSCNDERGAVYVEFLIAFFPVFLIFLAVCQLALVTAARVVVTHAAVTGVRSAIVVLEDPGDEHDNYDGVPLGILSNESGQKPASQVGGVSYFVAPGALSEDTLAKSERQTGPRMAPIRRAAQAPLTVLAPSFGALQLSERTLNSSVSVGDPGNEPFATAYTQAASAITVHASESSSELATEPLAPAADVTVRVAYLYHCAVPWVRTLMCSTLASLFNPDPNSSNGPTVERLKQAGAGDKLQHLVSSSERFTILVGQASLPNQGTAVPEEVGK
jgi:hypothetical protein